jgi:aspartokinase-like uncharacterized kinase
VRIDSVIKLGGGLLAHPEYFRAALDAIAVGATTERLVVVPGGGPFADTVRDVDRRAGLSSTAAHWMAVLAMDQYAHLIADRLKDGVVVEDKAAISEALGTARVPVLAPSRWLRAVDPLPHSWDVTSDSIAAWVAGALEAPRLVLIKPPGAAGNVVDPYFSHALPADVTVVAIAADRIHEHPDLR